MSDTGPARATQRQCRLSRVMQVEPELRRLSLGDAGLSSVAEAHVGP